MACVTWIRQISVNTVDSQANSGKARTVATVVAGVKKVSNKPVATPGSQDRLFATHSRRESWKYKTHTGKKWGRN